jgi:hypothetical protein
MITHAFLKVTLLNVCVSEEMTLDVTAKKTVIKIRSVCPPNDQMR